MFLNVFIKNFTTFFYELFVTLVMFYNIHIFHLSLATFSVYKSENASSHWICIFAIISIAKLLFSVALTFPAHRIVFAFFEARSPGKVHCFDCSLDFGVYQWIHVSPTTTVTKRRRNSFGLRLNSVKHCSKVEMVSRLRLLSGVRKRGTHRADSFLMLNISCRIWSTQFFEMPTTLSAISRTFNRRSANTTSWIFSRYPPW